MRGPGVLGYGWLALVYVYLFGPAALVAIYSFNSAAIFGMRFESATLRWFGVLAEHPEFVDAIRVSVQVAALAAAIGLLIGTPSAFAIVRHAFPMKDALVAFFLSPLVVPQIVMGVAMLQLVTVLSLPISAVGLVLAHGVFVTPYAIRTVITSLSRFDRALEEAAMGLGAGRWRTLWNITFPLVRPGLTAGFVLAFIMSFINVPLSLFLTTPTMRTLPMQLLNYLETRFDPFPAAVATIIMVGIFTLTIGIERLLKVKLLQ